MHTKLPSRESEFIFCIINGVCGFIFIQLDTLSTIKFAICILVAFGLILVWTLVFAFFNKYNAQILDE